MNTERDAYFSPQDDGTQQQADFVSWWWDPEWWAFLDRLEVQRKIELGIYIEGPEEF